MNINKIVLAYSGGLDTSVLIRWLRNKYKAEVIACIVDVGQGDDMSYLESKAIKTGASKVYIEDLREEFVRDYIFSAIKSNALYEGKYPLATSLARPLIAAKMVEIAEKEDADAVSHGCTGKGNDQVRFDVAFKTLRDNIQIIAPIRDGWDFTTREEEIAYAKEHDIPVVASVDKPYSLDMNIWGTSIECGILEDPWASPPADAYQMTIAPELAPDNASEVVIGFEAGVPVSLEGKVMDPVKLIQRLNDLGGAHGVGRIDIVENRVVGIKSREIYEAPAAAILLAAHKALEALTQDRELFQYSSFVSQRYAEIIYNGLWFSPLRKSLDAFLGESQRFVTGDVRVKLYKGRAVVTGRRSEYSLYDPSLATYAEGDKFDHGASKGFIDLWALPMAVSGRRDRRS